MIEREEITEDIPPFGNVKTSQGVFKGDNYVLVFL